MVRVIILFDQAQEPTAQMCHTTKYQNWKINAMLVKDEFIENFLDLNHEAMLTLSHFEVHRSLFLPALAVSDPSPEAPLSEAYLHVSPRDSGQNGTVSHLKVIYRTYVDVLHQ